MAKKAPAQKARGTAARTRAVTLIRRGIVVNSPWRLRLGLLIMGWSIARRSLQRDEEVVFSEQLPRGQRYLITHTTRRRR